jgi:hypothetical protein
MMIIIIVIHVSIIYLMLTISIRIDFFSCMSRNRLVYRYFIVKPEKRLHHYLFSL